MLKLYREGKKREVVGRVLRESITSDYHIYPSFGRTVFVELLVRDLHFPSRCGLGGCGAAGLRGCGAVKCEASASELWGIGFGRHRRAVLGPRDCRLVWSMLVRVGFVVQVTNPFAQEELFEVRIEDPFGELHLVTDADEWRYLREVRTPLPVAVTLLRASTPACSSRACYFSARREVINVVLCATSWSSVPLL
jgi:hypothetical protein